MIIQYVFCPRMAVKIGRYVAPSVILTRQLRYVSIIALNKLSLKSSAPVHSAIPTNICLYYFAFATILSTYPTVLATVKTINNLFWFVINCKEPEVLDTYHGVTNNMMSLYNIYFSLLGLLSGKFASIELPSDIQTYGEMSSYLFDIYFRRLKRF